MNIRQKVVILIATIAIFIMGIFPPYHLSGNNLNVTKFGFLFLPPTQSRTNISGWTYDIEPSLDTSRLYMQWALIILVGVGLTLFFRDQRNNTSD
jgi:hypothetical protein